MKNLKLKVAKDEGGVASLIQMAENERIVGGIQDPMMSVDDEEALTAAIVHRYNLADTLAAAISSALQSAEEMGMECPAEDHLREALKAYETL